MLLALLIPETSSAPALASSVDPEVWTPASPLSRPLLDAETRRAQWLAAERPGVPKDRIVQASGTARDAQNKPTGARGPVVRAVRSNASGPAYSLPLGKLGVSMYALRVVAMVPTEQLDRWRRPLVFEVTIDDGVHKTLYRQRAPYWDDFYEVAVVYFNVDAPRTYKATVRVASDSQVDAWIYSFELHDTLAGLDPTHLKSRPGTYTEEERSRLLASPKPADLQKVVPEVKLDPYLLGSVELDEAARRQRDDVLWNAVLPLNTQYVAEYDEGWLTREMHPGEMSADAAAKAYGAWQLSVGAFLAWHSRFELTNPVEQRTYSLDDLRSYRPLPDPYPFKDRGTGVYFPATGAMPHPEQWMPIANAVGQWWEGSRLPLAPYHGMNFDKRLPYLYQAMGNEHAARDAALMLARWAYLYPGLSDAQILGYAVVAPGIPYDRDMRLRWRRFGYQRTAALMLGLLHSYDQLFDYIKGNQELARAVGRYIPWIKTDEDLRRMIEVRLVQFSAKQILRWHNWDDTETPTWLLLAAVVEQNPAVTRPWLEDLWKRTWVYSYPESALPDLVATATQRDGTTNIGSTGYARTGSPFAPLVDLSHRYVANGGDARFALSTHQHGKLMRSALFPLLSTVAGGYPLTIGDVGGPAEPRVVDHALAFADMWKRGWSWTHDPRFAWLVVHTTGRTTETDAEWHDLETAAARCARDPFLSLRSRVLANWAAILEGGVESDDFRIKRATFMRVGSGQGHSHNDALDLQIVSHGVRLAGDLGERPGYRQPNSWDTLLHDRIEVDDKDNPRQGQWTTGGWVTSFAPLPGVQYMEAQSRSVSVDDYRRSVAMIDASPSDSYVVDIQRVAGGRWHTWCFHGPWSDRFEVRQENAHDIGPAASDHSDDARYLSKFLDGPGLKRGGVVPRTGPLVATWRLRRDTTPVVGTPPGATSPATFPQPNAEQQMLGSDYDPRSAPKYLRSYLFGHGDEHVLVANPSPTGPDGTKDTWPFLFVRRPNSDPAASVFAAVYEPYAGQPFLRGVERLRVAPDASDDSAPVALQVTTVDGRRDWIFSDGDASIARRVGAESVQASFAYRSEDAHGLRALEIVEGRAYRDGDVSIELAATAAVGDITKIDYPARTLWLRSSTPPALWLGHEIQITSAGAPVSYHVLGARTDGDMIALTVDEPLDVSQAEIVSVDAARRRVVASIGQFSLERDGRLGGVTLTVEALPNGWPVVRVSPEAGGRVAYELGPGADLGALSPGQRIALWDVGIGDRVRLPSWIHLQRVGTSASYAVVANVAFTVKRGSVTRTITQAELAAASGAMQVALH